MWVISITTENNETMTVFVANDAFDGVQPAIEEQDRISILQNFVARVVKKLRVKAPNTPLPTQPIFLEKMEFTSMADCRATIYTQPDANTVTKQIANLPALLLQQQSLLGEVGIRKFSIKEHAENGPEFAATQRAVMCAQEVPPVTPEDSKPTVMPLHGNEYTRAYLEALVLTLTEDNFNEQDNFTAHQMATSIATFTQATLEAIRDEELGDIDEISDIRSKYRESPEDIDDDRFGNNVARAKIRKLNDNLIKREAKHIKENKGLLYIDNLIGKHLTASYEYRAMIENIAVALHNAAKDYYLAYWKENQKDIAKLTAFRDDFNAFFNGHVSINEHFTLCPATETYHKLLKQNMEAVELQKLLSALLNASYNNGAFEYLAKRLNTLDGYFQEIAPQKIWDHRLVFAEHLSEIFESYHVSRKDLTDVPSRHVVEIYDEIEKSKKAVEDEAVVIRQMLRPNQPSPRHSSFWQRNKATITSLIIGTIIAATACAAIAIAPIALPALAIAGIAAAAALVVIGASILIGRIIDSCRRRPAKMKPALPVGTNKENQRLLDDFDDALNHDNPSRLQMSILIDGQIPQRPSPPPYKPAMPASVQPAFMHSSSKQALNTDKEKQEQRVTQERKQK